MVRKIGVTKWKASGIYKPEDVIKYFKSEKVAWKHAKKKGPEFVVRYF